MSNKYEDLIKNARMNADCGEHMSPAEVTTLLNVVEITFAALAAENAGLKAGILQASEDMEAHHDDHGLFSYDADGEQMDALLRLCDAQDSIASLENVKTQATDAFLAEVRASAVDEVCLKISNAIINCYQDEMIGLDEAATICGDFAAEIRKGVQS